MPRRIIRLVRGTYRRKAFGTERRPAYPPEAIVAFYACMELAEEQPDRGRFESEKLLRVLLEGPAETGKRYARMVPFLIANGDLVVEPGGRLYLDGWDELQEGDVTAPERMARYRARRNGATVDVTPDVTVPVTPSVTPGVTPAPARVSREAIATAIATAPAVERAGLPNLTPEAIAVLEDKTGRPWSQAGDKQLGEYDRLVGDHGLERVAAAFDEVCQSMDERPTARQLVWPAMKAIEPMPSLRVVAEEADDEEQKARDRRRNEAVWNRRLEWHRNTGQWDDAWGPEPVISSKGNQ